MNTKRLRSSASTAINNVVPLALMIALVIVVLSNVCKLCGAAEPATHMVVAQEQEVAPVATIVMDAPESCEVGDLVVIDASASVAKAFKWQITGVKEGNWILVDDGARAILAANAPGQISVTLAVAIADTVDLKTIFIQVGKSPAPYVDNESALRTKLQSLIAGINTPTKAEQQLALSRAFENVAELVETKVLTDRNKVVEYTSKLTRNAVDANSAEWEPVLVAVEDYVSDLVLKQRLVTIDDHVSAWRDIAAALR